MTIKASDAGWASAVGLVCALTTCTVFAVALVLALLCEFIVTGGIGETVDDSFVSTGGRICGATSLLAFVVGFGVAVWHAGMDDELFLGHELGEHEAGRSEEPARPWKRE